MRLVEGAFAVIARKHDGLGHAELLGVAQRDQLVRERLEVADQTAERGGGGKEIGRLIQTDEPIATVTKSTMHSRGGEVAGGVERLSLSAALGNHCFRQQPIEAE